jgi:hypothetical protein
MRLVRRAGCRGVELVGGSAARCDLWMQASLEQRQRFQQLFFPEGIAFDGLRIVRTGVTAPAFSYLREIRSEEGLVDQILSRWNPLLSWLMGERQRSTSIG